MFFFFASSQWNDCRFLLITLLTTFFASSILYHMPIFHRSLFKFMRSDIVEMTSPKWSWFKFLFCENYKLFRSDGWHPLLTNTAKSHAINHGRKDVSSLQTSISENHHPPSLYWKHNDNHYWNAINRKLPSKEKYLDLLK